MENELPVPLIDDLNDVNPQLPSVVSAFFSVAENLEKRFPQLSGEQSCELASSLFSEIAKNIEEGNHIAFIQPKDSGDVELTVYGFETLSMDSDNALKEINIHSEENF